MSYKDYQLIQQAIAEHEKKIQEAEMKLLPKSKQLALQKEMEEQQKINTLNAPPDPTQKLINTALHSLRTTKKKIYIYFLLKFHFFIEN